MRLCQRWHRSCTLACTGQGPLLGNQAGHTSSLPWYVSHNIDDSLLQFVFSSLKDTAGVRRPLLRAVGTPHQYPLGAAASYLRFPGMAGAAAYCCWSWCCCCLLLLEVVAVVALIKLISCSRVVRRSLLHLSHEHGTPHVHASDGAIFSYSITLYTQ